jgi:hypothetical protein
MFNKEEDLIEVGVVLPQDGPEGGIDHECLAAVRVSKSFAKISCIPALAVHIGLDDVVEVGPRGEFVRTISQGSRTAVGFFGNADEESKEALFGKLKAIQEHLEPFGVRLSGSVAGAFAGMVRFAMPMTMSVREAALLLNCTPHLDAHSLEDIDTPENG